VGRSNVRTFQRFNGCAALLADVPGFSVTGIQRRSERSGWKIEYPRGN
jgi:hypothetical protein